MHRDAFLALGFLAAGACTSDEPLPPQYLGQFHVTSTLDAADGTSIGSIFGNIHVPDGFEPTARIGDCAYFGERQSAGIELGTLIVTGVGAPAVVEPTSFIDGMLYLGSLEPDTIPEGTSVVAMLSHPTTDATTVEAVAPAPLTGVSLPGTIALTSAPAITWQAGDGERVDITLSVMGLGTSQTVTCKTDDTGSFTFPPDVLTMIEGTDSEGVLSVRRANTGTTVAPERAVDAEVRLFVESEVYRAVTVAR